MTLTGQLLFGLLCLLTRALADLPQGYHPVVISGPLLGQSLEILNGDESSWCYTEGKWQWLWGNPELAHLSSADNVLCLVEGLRLAGWDSKENVSVPKPKIKVRPKGGFTPSAGLDAIASLFGMDLLAKESHLGGRLRKLGYTDSESFIGHAYDWRLGVRDWQVSSFPVLRETIENAVKRFGTKVVMTGISMAGPYNHAFLSWTRSHDPDWPAKHVHAFVPVGAPFNGAVMALGAVISSALQTWSTDGDCPRCDPPKAQTTSTKNNLVDRFEEWFKHGAVGIADNVIKKTIWEWPSIYWLSTGPDYSTDPPTDPVVVNLINGATPSQCAAHPDSSTKCGASQTREGWKFDDSSYLKSNQCAECYKIVKGFESCKYGYYTAVNGWTQQLCCKRHICNAKEYRASELPALLKQVGREDSANIMEYALSVGTTADPGVPVHCIFAHNIQTTSKLAFHTSEDVGNENAVITLDDGDQTVDLKSAEVCTRWHSTVKVYRINGVKHSGLLDVEQVLDVIEAVATNNDKTWQDWTAPAYSQNKYIVDNTSVVPKSDLLVQNMQAGLLNLFV
jgi:hypothetical protein